MAAPLYMKAAFEESPVSGSPSLQRLLREHFGVTSHHLAPLHSGGKRPPTFVNSSIARPKTLVHANSMGALAQTKTPSVSSSTKNSELQPQKQRTSFATACGAIDDLTGIYLYADKKDEEDGASWECRQFPRASGYPKDPATGIAEMRQPWPLACITKACICQSTNFTKERQWDDPPSSKYSI
jgi:hypothetical protein